jgi:hypothetical protein
MKSGAFDSRRLRIPMVVLLFLLASPVPGRPQQKGSKSPSRPSPASTLFHEDWATPALLTSNLRIEPPQLASTDDLPGNNFVRQRYQVTWRPGDPFDLYVILPRGVSKPKVILYLYSFPDDTDLFKDDHWCEAATHGGYAAVAFVSALTGHRTRYRLLREWFVSEMAEALATSAHDVQLILDYLETRKDLDAGRVAMFGLGSGGSIAILASAVDSRIAVLDLVGPWADWHDWFEQTKIVRDEERANFLKPEFLAKVDPLDPVLWFPKTQAKSARLADIRQNTSMPDKAQQRLEASAPEVVWVDQYGNGKAFLAAEPPGMLFDWMKSELKTPDHRPARLSADRVHVHPALEPPPESWPNVGKLEVKTPAAKETPKP